MKSSCVFTRKIKCYALLKWSMSWYVNTEVGRTRGMACVSNKWAKVLTQWKPIVLKGNHTEILKKTAGMSISWSCMESSVWNPVYGIGRGSGRMVKSPGGLRWGFHLLRTKPSTTPLRCTQCGECSKQVDEEASKLACGEMSERWILNS